MGSSQELINSQKISLASPIVISDQASSDHENNQTKLVPDCAAEDTHASENANDDFGDIGNITCIINASVLSKARDVNVSEDVSSDQSTTGALSSPRVESEELTSVSCHSPPDIISSDSLNESATTMILDDNNKSRISNQGGKNEDTIKKIETFDGSRGIMSDKENDQLSSEIKTKQKENVEGSKVQTLQEALKSNIK